MIELFRASRGNGGEAMISSRRVAHHAPSRSASSSFVRRALSLQRSSRYRAA